MSKPLYILSVAAATLITTQMVFRLSHFKYGIANDFSEPFDLVSFTIKMIWWFGAWLFFWFTFAKLGRKIASRRRSGGAA